MKKLKQALSLTLALVLSLALAVPAFAAEHTAFPEWFTYEFDIPKVEKDITLHSSYEIPGPNPDSTSLNDNCYYFFNKKSEFKVSNVSANGVVAVMVYPYKWDAERGIYDYNMRDGVYALKSDGTWNFWTWHESSMDQAGFLKPGQSITYRMPDAASEKDVLYAVFTCAWDTAVSPDNGGEYHFEYCSFLPEGSADIGSSAGQSSQPTANVPAGSVAYTVQKGDTLSSITTNYYGDNAQRYALYNANAEAFQKTGGKLVPGMVLTIPAALNKVSRIPAAVAGAGEKLYTVKLGDTLGRIAAAEYGNVNAYKAIFERNNDRLKNANTIYEGQVIVLPAIK